MRHSGSGHRHRVFPHAKHQHRPAILIHRAAHPIGFLKPANLSAFDDFEATLSGFNNFPVLLRIALSYLRYEANKDRLSSSRRHGTRAHFVHNFFLRREWGKLPSVYSAHLHGLHGYTLGIIRLYPPEFASLDDDWTENCVERTCMSLFHRDISKPRVPREQDRSGRSYRYVYISG